MIFPFNNPPAIKSSFSQKVAVVIANLLSLLFEGRFNSTFFTSFWFKKKDFKSYSHRIFSELLWLNI